MSSPASASPKKRKVTRQQLERFFNENPLLCAVKGRIGQMTLSTGSDGRVRVSGPEPPPVDTLATMARVKAAAAYAHEVMRDPRRRAAYDAASKQRGMPCFALAVNDALKAPTITAVRLDQYTGLRRQRIDLELSDPLEAYKVRVVIRSPSGDLLETGLAKNLCYTTRKTLPFDGTLTVEVIVTDRPGNTTTQTIQHQVHNQPMIAPHQRRKRGRRARRKRGWLPRLGGRELAEGAAPFVNTNFGKAKRVSRPRRLRPVWFPVI